MSPVPLRDDWDVERIRSLAAERLGTWVADQRAATTWAVGECLPVFSMPVAPTRVASVSTWVDAMQWTSRWHVQVTSQGHAVGYARLLESASDVRVTGWTRDELAGVVELALEAADAYLPGDTHVALILEVRALAVSLLILVPRAEGTVFVTPLRVPRSGASFAAASLLPAAEFLSQLRLMAPIRAVIRSDS